MSVSKVDLTFTFMFPLDSQTSDLTLDVRTGNSKTQRSFDDSRKAINIQSISQSFLSFSRAQGNIKYLEQE